MAYRESFYRYLMTQRDADSSDEVAQFANNAQHDLTFPKQEQDYEELSDYLEHYVGSSIFNNDPATFF